ncbi:MAG: carboxypeptidase-like regulatory domain-containing protein [Longimicrobiales bacterium]|nr:carboxypeptidase-like regulatory domain-containing protein [Longimicrobiales bacterium]
MTRLPVLRLLAAAVLFSACADATVPTGPAPDTAPEPALDAPPVGRDVGAPPEEGVGTFGRIDEIKPQEQGLVLYQTGFEAVAQGNAVLRGARHELSVGARHARLQVQIRDSTEIWVGGERVEVSALEVGMDVLVVGRVTGAAIHADRISDLSDTRPPEEGVEAALAAPASGDAPVAAPAGPAPADVTSMCMGQRLPFDPVDDPDVAQFQGCWGGPSASDYLNTGFIPVFCPLIGCVGFDRLTYTMALGGWGFAFPMRFEAGMPSNLVYHVPAQVPIGVHPEAADPAASFWGGLGVDFGIRFKFCGIFGCYNLGTMYLSAFSTIHRSEQAAPLTGQVLGIQTTSCPSIALIPVENFPLNPLSLGLCQTLELRGAPFRARVRVTGAEPSWTRYEEYGPAGAARTIRPGAMSVGVHFDEFWWQPELHQGLAFRFKSFNIRLYQTPSIPLGGGRWDAVTTPYPGSGSVFTVATDPLSPVNDLRYLHHPTAMTLQLEVDPAPTALVLTSDRFRPEGTPVTVRLSEAFDDAPVAGHAVTLHATGAGGTHDTTLTAATDGAGVAAFLLPPGEYRLEARYAGAETYLPSTDTQEGVYVFTPTTFVVWGGNPGGLAPGDALQFWGSGWVRQVEGGAWAGNASFQGFALLSGPDTWVSPPASSGAMPGRMTDVISVLVTTRVERRGSRSHGNVVAHAILRVADPEGYRPAAGHAARGILRTFLP